MRYLIESEIRLELGGPVREHHCELRATPRQDDLQKIVSLEVSTEPAAKVRSHEDCFGNRVHRFEVLGAHDRLAMRVRAVVDTLLDNPFGFKPVRPELERAWLEQKLAAEPRLLDFVLHRSPLTPGLEPDAESLAGAPRFDGKTALLETAIAARDWLADRLKLRIEPAETPRPLETVLAEGTADGVEMTHALLSLVRSWGVPVRYVTGCHEISPDGAEDAENTKDAEDAEDAPSKRQSWAEVLIPGAGWRGLDVVNRLVVNDLYVAIAVGRDASDTTPLRRAYKGEGAGEEPSELLRFGRQEQ